MSSDASDFSMSQLSLHSQSSQGEDWDRSESDITASDAADAKPRTTPRNSVAFPAGTEGGDGTPGGAGSKGKRTLSELLKIHAEKGTDVKFSPEEAARVADVLGQWINSGSSPYEGDDDFFTSHDDSSLPAKRSPCATDVNGRPRGQSESTVSSRPPSVAS